MTAAVLCLGSVMPAYADFYRQPSNIKGVLINSESEVTDVVEVGASQVVCNFPMSWAFQPNMMNAYGSFLRAMDNAGITVTMIVLNDWNAAAYKPELLPVSAPVAGVSYYGFNTLNEQGVQAIRDTAGILTSNFGNLVSNWVIGNEVNDGQVWNYLGSMDIDTTAPTMPPPSVPGMTPSRPPIPWPGCICPLISAGTAASWRALSTASWTCSPGSTPC